MRVVMIANHNPFDFPTQFEAEVLAAGWRSSAPHCEVVPLAFSHCEPGSAAVWREHATRLGGFDRTAFISACEPSRLEPAEFSRNLAEQFYVAVTSGMNRVVLALPTFLEPDAGVVFLTHLARLIREGSPESVSAQAQAGAVAAVADLLGPDKDTRTDELIGAVAAAREFISRIDVVGAYASNMPLLGMHGMSGAAALEGLMGQDQAQVRERQVSELFHALVPRYAALPAARQPLGLAGTSLGGDPQASLKDLTRHDGSGAAGGLGFGLLLVGARLLPAATVFATQFELRDQIAGAELVVIYQDKLDGRAFPDQVGHWAAQVATEFITPVIVVCHEQIMSVRELSGQQVASAYQVERGERALFDRAARLAKSWTPANR